MEPCHSRLCCWQKSDLVRQTVAAICYLHCDSLKNIYICGCLLNLWLVMVLHFLSWQKVQTIPFFSSLKCKSTRRLCKKGLGSRQRAAAYPRCCCRSAHETAQHITCSQICCTGFLCVRVSFRIQHFYFFCTLHSIVLGWNTWLLALPAPRTSQVVRGEFTLCPIKFAQTGNATF